jgi:hypothetical protein
MVDLTHMSPHVVRSTRRGTCLPSGAHARHAHHAGAPHMPAALRAESAEGRLAEAAAQGDAAEVTLLVKHLSKALHSSQLTMPAQVLCGIAGACSRAGVHMAGEWVCCTLLRG